MKITKEKLQKIENELKSAHKEYKALMGRKSSDPDYQAARTKYFQLIQEYSDAFAIYSKNNQDVSIV